MKVDFNTPLIDVRDGTDLTYLKQTKKGTKDEVLTFGIAAAEGLGAVAQDEQTTLSQADKLKRGLLIQQIFQQPQSEISIEEANLIRERVGKVYGPLVVVAIEKVLDPKPEIVSEEPKRIGEGRTKRKSS